jgi:hypothetical protein
MLNHLVTPRTRDNPDGCSTNWATPASTEKIYARPLMVKNKKYCWCARFRYFLEPAIYRKKPLCHIDIVNYIACVGIEIWFNPAKGRYREAISKASITEGRLKRWQSLRVSADAERSNLYRFIQPIRIVYSQTSDRLPRPLRVLAMTSSRQSPWVCNLRLAYE